MLAGRARPLSPTSLGLRERGRRHSRAVAFVDEKWSVRRAMAAPRPTKMPLPNRPLRTARRFPAWGLSVIARRPQRAIGWWEPPRWSGFQSSDASAPSPLLMVPAKSVAHWPPQGASPLPRIRFGSRGTVVRCPTAISLHFRRLEKSTRRGTALKWRSVEGRGWNWEKGYLPKGSAPSEHGDPR